MTGTRPSNARTATSGAAMRRWARRLPHAPQTTLSAGVVVWTVRAVLHRRGGEGVWAAILAWVLIGIPTVVDLHHYRLDGRLPPLRSHKWE